MQGKENGLQVSGKLEVPPMRGRCVSVYIPTTREGAGEVAAGSRKEQLMPQLYRG